MPKIYENEKIIFVPEREVGDCEPQYTGSNINKARKIAQDFLAGERVLDMRNALISDRVFAEGEDLELSLIERRGDGFHFLIGE